MEINEKGSAFGRIWATPNKPEVTMTDEKSVISGGGTEETITQFLPICGEGNYHPSETVIMELR
jgi:hypothetical protein